MDGYEQIYLIVYVLTIYTILYWCICVTVTLGVISAGLDGGGGAPYRLVFIRARAPPVAVCLVYK